MELQELMNDWQAQNIQPELDTQILKRLNEFNDNLKKENKLMLYILPGTIYVLGFAVLPFLNSAFLMTMVAALMFLVGLQAIALVFRQINLKKSMSEKPEKYIRTQLRTLRYNLLVTNMITPVYMLILGAICSFYTINLLKDVSITMTYIALGITWTFLIAVFFFGWVKQRKKDKKYIIPAIEELQGHLKSMDL